MKINLGCGRNTFAGWVNVDRTFLPGVDVVVDLSRSLPFSDGCADELLLSHVIEHIPHPLDLMQELHRIAVSDARLVVSVPFGSSDDAWEDPTHLRPYFLNSFNYFAQPWYWRADYGYRGDWKTEEIILVIDERFRGRSADEIMSALRTERNVASEMIVALTAIKPIREPLAELQTAPRVLLTFNERQPNAL